MRPGKWYSVFFEMHVPEGVEFPRDQSEFLRWLPTSQGLHIDDFSIEADPILDRLLQDR